MSKKVKYFSLIFIICLVILVQSVQSAVGDNVSGYAWSETIGWINFNGSNYGVNLDTGNGKFSGYAWSEHIGWITFNEGELSGCPQAPCRAEVSSPGQLGRSDVDIKGWARALAYGGGWDGWIRFDHGQLNEPYINTSGEFFGWAWGSDVVGWISLRGANYGVTAEINNPPDVDCVDCDDSETCWNYCSDSRNPFLSWIYSDSDGDLQESYQLQIDDNPSFSSPEIDTGEVFSSGTTYHPTGETLDWDTTYRWRVKVKDDRGAWSDWSSPACSFTTPLHAYPDTDFIWSPTKPSALEPVQFTDQTDFYNGENSWFWTFESAVPASSILQNPVTTFSNPGNWDVTLEATDSDGFMCPATKAVNVSAPLPEWKEVKPK